MGWCEVSQGAPSTVQDSPTRGYVLHTVVVMPLVGWVEIKCSERLGPAEHDGPAAFDSFTPEANHTGVTTFFFLVKLIPTPQITPLPPHGWKVIPDEGGYYVPNYQIIL